MALDSSPIEVTHEGDVICISLCDSQVQGAVLPHVAQDCIKAIKDVTSPRVVFNFEGIEYFPSTGLGTLIEFKQAIHDRGGEFRLAGLEPHICDLFRISGLNHVFKICATVADALSELQSVASRPAPK
ncbi:MAG: STAS domain-containing protein [Phycisphaeraceae bacterium]